MAHVYDEVIDFIASGMTPDTLITFEPSKAARERAWSLLERRKDAELSADEASELEHYLQLEHIMRLAKARARIHQTR